MNPLIIDALAFSPDGKILASGSRSTIQLWDVKTAQEIIPFPKPRNPPGNLVFCGNDKILAGVSWGDAIYGWDLDSGEEIWQLKGHSKDPGSLAASADGQTLISVGIDGVVSLWDLAQRKELQFFQVDKHCSPRAISPDGKLLASGSSNPRDGKIYDICSGKELGRFGAAFEAIFVPDGKSLMLRVPNRGLARWDIATGRIASWLVGHNPQARGMAVSADGKIFASGTTDNLVHRWDLDTGEQLSSVDGQQKTIDSLAFSPDGRSLASGGQDGTIWLWETYTGGRRLVLHGHKGSVLSLSFSRDGRRLASGSKDTTVLVWDLTAGSSIDPSKDFTAEQLDGLWRDLAGDDAAKAYQSIWELASLPKRSLPFLNARLRPIPIPDVKRISQLLADLDSEDFKVRTKAHEELEKLGEAAAAPLRQTAEKPPSAEVGRRVKELRDKLKTEARTPPPQRIQVLRAVEVLEHIGTLQACQSLKGLANGAAGAQLTQEAKASLDRLAKRAKR
jgi:WD40 repeat protein